MKLIGIVMIIVGYFTMMDYGNARIIADFGTRTWFVGLACMVMMTVGFILTKLRKEETDSRAA